MILKYSLFSCEPKQILNVWLVDIGKKGTLYVYHTKRGKKVKTILKRGIDFDDAALLSRVGG